MAARLRAFVKAYAGRAFALALVVGVFAFVLPRVADYGEVWDALSALSDRGLVALVVAATVNLATFGPPWMAALPGLSFLHALVCHRPRRPPRACSRAATPSASRSRTRCSGAGASRSSR